MTKLTIIDKISNWINLYITRFMVIFLVVYAILPILSPIAYKVGVPEVGTAIQFVYRIFCHQRVDRSAFLFGEKGLVNFYSITDLKEVGYLPEINPHAPTRSLSRIYFAYPYYGNEEIGYKMPYCIRDFGLYTALAFTAVFSLIYMEKNKKIIKLPWVLLIGLMLPMALDGIFQTYVEIFGFPYLSQDLLVAYVVNIPKRVITGALFGIGFGLAVIPLLKESADMIPAKDNV